MRPSACATSGRSTRALAGAVVSRFRPAPRSWSSSVARYASWSARPYTRTLSPCLRASCCAVAATSCQVLGGFERDELHRDAGVLLVEGGDQWLVDVAHKPDRAEGDRDATSGGRLCDRRGRRAVGDGCCVEAAGAE